MHVNTHSMTDFEVFLQQLLAGFSNGMIIALIALGYTMVYGIIELINFAHGDLFMLGAFLALTLIGSFGFEAPGPGVLPPLLHLVLLFVSSAAFCGGLNWCVDRFAYRPLRGAPRLSPLVSAIGVSFIFMNFGLFWGGLPMDVFNQGRTAAAPKDVPDIFPVVNLLGDSALQYTTSDLMIALVTFPLMAGLTVFIKCTRIGKAMRATAQDPTAARLMGIDIDRVTGITFVVGGALAGVASVVFALYNHTVHFQMGFRTGIDAFSAAVLGGIGNLPGAVIGGIMIGIIRAMSDQYLGTMWTNCMVFLALILTLILRPSGLLGSRIPEKV